MAAYRITQFDETKPEFGPGAFVFELEGKGGKLVYSVRRANGSFWHMDGNFEHIKLTHSERAKRENAINAYMTVNAEYFGR